MAVSGDPRLQRDARENTALRTFIVSGIRFYREGLAQLLATHPNVEIVGEAAPEAEVLDHVTSAAPSVVLVDISSQSGIVTLRALAERLPNIPAVALAVTGSDSEILDCVEAGVAGYVTCDASHEEVVAVLTNVARGELYCPALVAGVLRRRLAAIARGRDEGIVDPPLTSRELEIVRLLGSDLSNKEIARRLNIEVSTVKSHVHHILEKLRVRHRAEAAARVRSRARQVSRQIEIPLTESST
jgi:two-component system, NarL family, nitrate/nitrite response regulator NarL